MKSSEFFSKLCSKYLWGNLLAMAGVVLLLCLGVKFGIDLYTHHGEAILIPNVKHMPVEKAEEVMRKAGLVMVVSDTGYVKALPPDCVLEQTPGPGEAVKSGHIIYVTINSVNTPTLTLPDVIDNSSLREAMAKLTSMGFNLGQPQYIPGEKDWVYGITVNGHHVVAGDKIPVDAKLIILVGNGNIGTSDSIDEIGPDDEDPDMQQDNSETDPFQEVPDVPADNSQQ